MWRCCLRASRGADHPGAAQLAAAIRDTVEDDLQDRVGLDLVPRDEIDRYVDGVARDTGHQPRARAIRVATGADEILAILLACSSDGCKATLARDPAAPARDPAAHRAPIAHTFPLLIDAARSSEPMALYLSIDSHNIASYLSSLYPDHAPQRR